jgi:hypothetical protein
MNIHDDDSRALPDMVEVPEIATAMCIDALTVRKMCRQGRLAGAVKVTGRRWIVPRKTILGLLAGEITADADAAETMELLGALARQKSTFTDEQVSLIRQAHKANPLAAAQAARMREVRAGIKAEAQT